MQPPFRTNLVLMLLMFPVLAFLAMVQSVTGPWLSLFQAKPNLVLLAVLAWTLIRGRREGMMIGFLGGFWLDFLGLGTLGLSSVALVVASFVVGIGRRSVLTTHILVPAWVAVLGTLVYVSVYHLLLAATGATLVWFWELRRFLAVHVLYQTTLMLLFTPLLRSMLQQRSNPASIHVG